VEGGSGRDALPRAEELPRTQWQNSRDDDSRRLSRCNCPGLLGGYSSEVESLKCDSEEAAKQSKRSISIGLEKSILPQIKIHPNDSILGFILFAMVRAKTRVRSLGFITALGEPIHESRLDCISTCSSSPIKSILNIKYFSMWQGALIGTSQRK